MSDAAAKVDRVADKVNGASGIAAGLAATERETAHPEKNDEAGQAHRARPNGAVKRLGASIAASFSGRQWLDLLGLYGFIAMLHLLGWGLYVHYSAHHTALIGLGFIAYMLGLRHAFDADHIAAVDDTVRYMLQKGKQPLGVGFFFSLGHSTVVLALTLLVAFAAAPVVRGIPQLQAFGSIVGSGVSGIFLWTVGVLNLFVLLDILKAWRRRDAQAHEHAHLEEILERRGFINRLFGGRLQKLIEHSWQMYPLGLLFGLGFDTASSIALLGIAAAISAGSLPAPAMLSLPILFAAGMSAMDTTDGVLMSKAYRWALTNPRRKISYNVATTSLSIVVALAIGTIELLQVSALVLKPGGDNAFFSFIGHCDFGVLGYVIVALFLLAWAVSFGMDKARRRNGEAAGSGPARARPYHRPRGARRCA